MKLSAFAIHDEKACSFMTPVYFNYKGQASRWFEDLIKENNNPISKHPEDYSLYHIGYFNQYDARLEALNVPELVIRANDFQNIGA